MLLGAGAANSTDEVATGAPPSSRMRDGQAMRAEQWLPKLSLGPDERQDIPKPIGAASPRVQALPPG